MLAVYNQLFSRFIGTTDDETGGEEGGTSCETFWGPVAVLRNRRTTVRESALKVQSGNLD